MLSLWLLLANVSLPAQTRCPLPFEIAGTETAALAIAKVVIASAPKIARDDMIARYDLHIAYVRERRSWRVHESAVAAEDGIRILGGNGLEMEIAACDGTVSDIHRQR